MVDEFAFNGIILMRAKEERIEKTIENMVVRNLWGYKVGIVNTNHHISEVGSKIAETCDIAVVWRMVKEKIVVGFRSKEFDVATIAQLYGGGGHKLASGCQIDFKTLLGWLK
jgi:nanoRNase/pAp phosphatase (c-di-AMP/oligoRNAs hydrolase)